MTAGAMTLALAMFFTLGCITIHESQKHAKAMTPLLALATVCLFVFTGLVALAGKPEADAQRKSTPSMKR